jgi:AraC-like DNA-binding protein
VLNSIEDVQNENVPEGTRMTLAVEQRLSDSPYVEAVMHGWTMDAGSSIRPAETNWHMVIVKHSGGTQFLVVGPLTSSGLASWGADAEILWIKFKLGTFMPNLPVRSFLDGETQLPGAAHQSFYLDNTTWQYPNFDNVETFVNRLIQNEVLVFDPLIADVLQGHLPDMAPRTVRYRFLRATGQTQGQIFQMERARHAASLLEQGVPILDTVHEAGYFDQPHLTRSLKRFLGKTPARLLSDCQSVQDSIAEFAYHRDMTAALEQVR